MAYFLGGQLPKFGNPRILYIQAFAIAQRKISIYISALKLEIMELINEKLSLINAIASITQYVCMAAAEDTNGDSDDAVAHLPALIAVQRSAVASVAQYCAELYQESRQEKSPDNQPATQDY